MVTAGDDRPADPNRNQEAVVDAGRANSAVEGARDMVTAGCAEVDLGKFKPPADT